MSRLPNRWTKREKNEAPKYTRLSMAVSDVIKAAYLSSGEAKWTNGQLLSYAERGHTKANSHTAH